MERSLNKVFLIGRCGKDCEVRFTQSGVACASFSLATGESWKDADGAVQERTQWHQIVAYRKLAEICGEYLKKGSKVHIEGKIQYRTYDDKNGVKRYVTEIVVDGLIMLDGRAAGAAHAQESEPEQPKAESPVKVENFDDGSLPF